MGKGTGGAVGLSSAERAFVNDVARDTLGREASAAEIRAAVSAVNQAVRETRTGATASPEQVSDLFTTRALRQIIRNA